MEHHKHHGIAIGKYGLGPTTATGAGLRNPGKSSCGVLRVQVPGGTEANGRPVQTETLFQTYSQFSQVPDIPPKPTEEEKATEAKLEEILEKVSAWHPSRV